MLTAACRARARLFAEPLAHRLDCGRRSSPASAAQAPSRVFIQAFLLNALSMVLLVGLVGGAMIYADPWLAAPSLVFAPPAGLVLAKSGVALRRTWNGVQEQMSRLTLIMEENLQGVRVMRAFATNCLELGKFDEAVSTPRRDAPSVRLA